MSFSRPFQWYHSEADPIWPDGTFKKLTHVHKLNDTSLLASSPQGFMLNAFMVPAKGENSPQPGSQSRQTLSTTKPKRTGPGIEPTSRMMIDWMPRASDRSSGLTALQIVHVQFYLMFLIKYCINYNRRRPCFRFFVCHKSCKFISNRNWSNHMSILD